MKNLYTQAKKIIPHHQGSTLMVGVSMVALLIVCMGVPTLALATKKLPVAVYRYSRVAADADVHADGTVRIEELYTMLYQSGSFREQWRNIFHGDAYTVSDVRIYDGSTGAPMTFATTTLAGTDPSSWGKYTFSDAGGVTKIVWYFNVRDRVHTWIVRYTLHGGVTFLSDHDEFAWDVFSNFDVPVDTVEAQVHLPSVVTQPQSTISTSGNHDYYIDRPDDKTFRFRVSDIGWGEKVSIQVGWQKGLVYPKVLLPPARFMISMRLLIVGVLGVVALLLILISVYIDWKYKNIRPYVKRLWGAVARGCKFLFYKAKDVFSTRFDLVEKR